MGKVYVKTTCNRTLPNLYKLEETSRISVLTCDICKARKCGHGMVKKLTTALFLK